MIGYNRVCYKHNNTGLRNSQEMKTLFLVLFYVSTGRPEPIYAPTQWMYVGNKPRWAGPDLSGVLPVVAFKSDANGAISAD